jgi:hypothetical protein
MSVYGEEAMTNFVFGVLIGLFIVLGLVVAALGFLDSLLDQGGVVVSPLGALLGFCPPR